MPDWRILVGLSLFAASVVIGLLSGSLSEGLAVGVAQFIAFLTWAYVAATKEMADATRRLAEEAASDRRERTRPRVDVRLDFGRGGLVELVIANSGATTARSLDVRLEPSPTTFRDEPLTDFAIFSGRPTELHSGSTFKYILGTVSEMKDNRDKVGRFDARVRYSDGRGEEYQEDFHLDIALAFGGHQPPPDYLQSIAESLESIAQRR